MGRYLVNHGLAGLIALVLFASVAFFMVQIMVYNALTYGVVLGAIDTQ